MVVIHYSCDGVHNAAGSRSKFVIVLVEILYLSSSCAASENHVVWGRMESCSSAWFLNTDMCLVMGCFLNFILMEDGQVTELAVQFKGNVEHGFHHVRG